MFSYLYRAVVHLAHLYRICRVLFFPILVACGMWMLYLQPALVLKHTPVVPELASFSATTSISQAPPVYPSTPLQAFELGALVNQFQSTADATTQQHILAKVASMTGRETVNSAELLGLNQLLLEVTGWLVDWLAFH